MVWTRFMDMHSGGGQKLDWAKVYIEAPEEDAAKVFMHRFGRNPNNITCSCCGEDYSFRDSETLEQASAFDRHCKFDDKLKKYVEEPDPTYVKYGEGFRFIPFQKWLAQESPNDERESFTLIYAKDIKLEELKGETPRRGHLVWVED